MTSTTAEIALQIETLKTEVDAMFHSTGFRDEERMAAIREEIATLYVRKQGWNVEGRYALALNGEAVKRFVAPRFETREQAAAYLATTESASSPIVSIVDTQEIAA